MKNTTMALLAMITLGLSTNALQASEYDFLKLNQSQEALEKALADWNPQAVADAIDSGANPNFQFSTERGTGRNGDYKDPRRHLKVTPLMRFVYVVLENIPADYALRYKNCIITLVNKGASVNQKDLFGRTPLHYAAMKRNTLAIPTLILKGANKTLQDDDHKTAEQIARKKGDNEIADLIKNSAIQPRSRQECRAAPCA